MSATKVQFKLPNIAQYMAVCMEMYSLQTLPAIVMAEATFLDVLNCFRNGQVFWVVSAFTSSKAVEREIKLSHPKSIMMVALCSGERKGI